ncbi:2-haloacid dehalogenase [Rhodovulum imhoffii]|uniref:2-haloacid dehalogenase n=2 Tax=Rhodovulum imhoffii TaxID=365340 RepID=A0A2T5BU21_9RHOB|nr:2-haloacid dehalogenase [Rhodovulum imhoffii]
MKAVVFDIGRVLIDWQPVRFYRARLGAARQAALFDAVDLEGMNAALDLGAPFRETVCALADKHPAYSEEIRLWHDSWLQMASPAIPGTATLLRALKARSVPVFALSNFGLGPFDLARAAYPVLKEFDRTYLSGALRLAKPDPAIYAAVEEDCGLPPEALLFTDDRPENIAAARARGWQTHLFAGAPDLAARLMAEGLLPHEGPHAA